MIETTRTRLICPYDGSPATGWGNNGGRTYARRYNGSPRTDALRKRFFDCNAEECKSIGKEYSDGRPCLFNFRVVNEFGPDDPRRFLTCYAYAISTFGEKLEAISGIKIGTFQQYLRMNNIDHIVSTYFENVDEPRDGDLAVCTVTKSFHDQGTYIKDTTHAGICRFDEDGNLCLESKWGPWRMPYVFRHPCFFSSPIDGDFIRFYRLKEAPVEKNAFSQLLEENYSK